jgi:hypothetical protein
METGVEDGVTLVNESKKVKSKKIKTQHATCNNLID